MKHSLALATCLVALYGGDALAQGAYLYGGVHPINPTAGGGFCYTAEQHPHEYPVDPSIAYLYRDYGGYQYFVGNVYDFGYQGEAFPYYGNHPIPTWGSYCYLDGVHYHSFLPPAGLVASYVVQNGYYYYRGSYSPTYYSYRSRFYRARHSFWYSPAYRTHHANYAQARRTYARPASVTYITRPPRIVYRHVTPPVRTVTRVVVRPNPTPAYQHNVQRPNTYNTYYRPAPARPTVTQPTVTRPTMNRPAMTRPTVMRPTVTAPTRTVVPAARRPTAPAQTWRRR